MKRIQQLLRRFINWIAPVGYQDGDGFHYGNPPDDKVAGLLLALSIGALTASAATSIQTNSGNSYFANTLTNGVYADAKIRLTFDKFAWTSATVGTNTDLSGNGNHAGTASGINQTNSAVPGLRGQAISAQPIAPNGYLQCRSDATIDDLQLQGGGGMSLEFCILFKSGSGTVIAKGASSGRFNISTLASSYPFGLSFTKSCATTSYVENFANMFFSNRWYHVVITWDGGVVTNSTKLYIDGQRALSTTVTTGVGAVNSDAANNLTLVNVPGGTAPNIWFDDFSAWARILSQDEITLLYAGSRISQQFPVTANPFTATNILSFEGVANGTVLDTTLMGTVTKGAAMGTPSITGAAADWTVVTSSNMTALNPITVAGTTYSAQSNTLACNLGTGSSSSLNWTFPGSGYGNVSGCFSFMTGLRQIPSSAVNFDVFTVNAVANQGVAQINEGGGDFFLRAHSIKDGVTFTGQRTLRLLPYRWYDCGWLWDTNSGNFHLLVYNTAAPLLEDTHRLILHSVSPIRANSNATSFGPCNNPHGTARVGLTNWFRFIAWQYTMQTNAAMIALRSPFAQPMPTGNVIGINGDLPEYFARKQEIDLAFARWSDRMRRKEWE